jgi:hypothetical protein
VQRGDRNIFGCFEYLKEPEDIKPLPSLMLCTNGGVFSNTLLVQRQLMLRHVFERLDVFSTLFNVDDTEGLMNTADTTGSLMPHGEAGTPIYTCIFWGT